jgi:hypothetical protein
VGDPDEVVLRAPAVERVVGGQGRPERHRAAHAEAGAERKVRRGLDATVGRPERLPDAFDGLDVDLLPVEEHAGLAVGDGEFHAVGERDAATARPRSLRVVVLVSGEEGGHVAGHERRRHARR